MNTSRIASAPRAVVSTDLPARVAGLGIDLVERRNAGGVGHDLAGGRGRAARPAAAPGWCRRATGRARAGSARGSADLRRGGRSALPLRPSVGAAAAFGGAAAAVAAAAAAPGASARKPATIRSRSGGTGSLGAASMVRIRSVAVSDRSISARVTASRPLRTCSNAASISCANDEIASRPNIPLEPFTVWIARKMRSTSAAVARTPTPAPAAPPRPRRGDRRPPRERWR